MTAAQPNRPTPALATLTLPGATRAPDSPDGVASLWPVTHSLAGFRVVLMPPESAGLLARFLIALWPLLSNAALEVRWIAAHGRVTCYVLARHTSDDADTGSAGAQQLMTSARSMAAALLPGWSLVPLGADELADAVNPFEIADAGDLLRREQQVTLSGGQEHDIPALLAIDSSELGLLVALMAESEHPVALSLAAAPTDIDEAERAVLLGELAALERALRESSVPQAMREYGGLRESADHDDPASSIARAAETLHRRVFAPERLGFLRVSLASAGPLTPTLIATAQEALAATALTLEWMPAYEKRDREVCARNIKTIDFKPWGIQAVEQPGHETVNDCYLASLEEIVAELAVPAPDGFLQLAHELIDPAPRPVPSAAPREGRMLGNSLFGGRSAALSHSDRLRHTYIVGQTGTGKSTLLLNLAVQDIREGRGVCVIDPHGDLIDGILDRFPENRADDLILFDPMNADRPVPLNLLDARTPEEQDYVVQQMVGMLYRIYDPNRQGIVGPRFENMFRNSALVAMAHPDGGTLLDLARLFNDGHFRENRLKFVTDPSVLAFWNDEWAGMTDYQKNELLGWFTSKFGAFTSNRFMRAVIGQRQSAVSMHDVMDSGKVLLVKLPRGLLGDTNAIWLGLIFIVRLQMAALARASMPPSERSEFNLYVDEFQNFAMTDFDLLVAEARKYGLALTLAHQHVDQLTPELRAAIFGNVASWVMFRLGMPDATTVSKELAEYSARDLARLANYRCVVRTSVDGSVLTPFDVRTFPPSDELNTVEARDALKTLSLAKYGRPIEIVESEYLESWGRSAKKQSPERGEIPSVTVPPAAPDDAKKIERSVEQRLVDVLARAQATVGSADSADLLGVPVFGEPAELKAGRAAIADLIVNDELDGALAAIREVFIKTDYSPDCWVVFEDMKRHFSKDGSRVKYEAVREELLALSAGPPPK